MITINHKRFFAKATRYHGECYNPAISSETYALAYLKAADKREALIYKKASQSAEIVVAEGKYIFNPVFCGGRLFWVEQAVGGWSIKAARETSSGPTGETTPFLHRGRPLMLAACGDDNNGGWCVWEERDGLKTRVRAAAVNRREIGEAVPVTSGDFNAYDPVCAVGSDGMVYVVYCAFHEGDYRIFLQKLSRDGKRVGKPFPVSDEPGPCLYPSVCARRKGGAWISYTYYPPVLEVNKPKIVRHFRRRMHHGLFNSAGHVRAGVFDGKMLWGVKAPPVEANGGNVRGDHGFIAAGHVYGADYSGHSHIMEDRTGRAHLLFRKHAIDDNGFFAKDKKLQEDRIRRTEKYRHRLINRIHPDICLTTLTDDGWAEPARLVPKAHHESPLSFVFKNNRLRFAFTEDGRYSGYERLDDSGEVGVGVIDLKIAEAETPPAYELQPFILSPGNPSFEEPAIKADGGGYIFAMGQTHTHSSLSDCRRAWDKDPHFNYRFMQDVQHCLFGAVVDHGFNMWRTETLLMHKLAEYYYFPGKFIAIPAYEWTGSSREKSRHFGHVNPLYLEDEGELEVFTPADMRCKGNSLLNLWKVYSGKKIITPPHHVTDKIHAYNWNFFDDRFMPVVELFQDERGSGEDPRAPGASNKVSIGRKEKGWVVDILKSGKRFGFIGGADHQGVALAGVLLKKLDRASLYEGLMSRRCFATTGISIQLRFTCNGAEMGASVKCGEAEFALGVDAPEAMREIQVVRNGKAFKRIKLKEAAFTCKHRWKAGKRKAGEFWYCRIIFKNGEMAWSSPIWLD